jgi:hypothetical protein
MGDRTYCALITKEPLPQDLQDLLDKQMGKPNETQGTWFGYEEVNYGELDQSVRDALTSQKVTFAWQWSAGCTFGPGMLIGHEGEITAWNTNRDHDLIFTLEELNNPELVKTAKIWDGVFREIFRAALVNTGEVTLTPFVTVEG